MTRPRTIEGRRDWQYAKDWRERGYSAGAWVNVSTDKRVSGREWLPAHKRAVRRRANDTPRAYTYPDWLAWTRPARRVRSSDRFKRTPTD